MPSSLSSTRSRRRLVTALLAPAALLLVTACGADEPAELAEPAESGEPQVFFIQPTDGATITSPFEVVMGSRNIEVGAVPEVVDAPRPGIIHYHLGTNTDCLPVGEIVPQAAPWIHFGDGSNEIESNLPPGEHRLVLQAGDDDHRTLEGLCSVISITVVEGG